MRIEAAAEEAVLAAVGRDAFTGISFPKIDDKRTWIVRFVDGVTDDQKAAARAALDALDLAAEAAKLKPKSIEERISDLETEVADLKRKQP